MEDIRTTIFERADVPPFLSNLPAGRKDRQAALIIVALSAAIFAGSAPFARVQLPALWGFLPAYEAALILSDLVTAVFLFAQFTIVRTRELVVLACGYLLTGLTAVAHLLTFPGAFSPTGLLGAGPQTTAWLFMFWHAAFPIAVIAYAFIKSEAGALTSAAACRLLLACVAAAVGCVVLMTVAATLGHSLLPAIMRGNNYTPAMLIVVSGVWMLSTVALLSLWLRRPHTVLDVWLMAVMCAWLCDIALSAVLNGGRFDLGFYVGRIFGLAAATVVLVALLIETGALYAKLSRWFAAEQQGHRREMEERQLIFDTSLDLILVTDRQGNFVRVSPSSFSILGFRPEEMIGRSAVGFIHADDLEPTRNEMRLARRGKQLRNFGVADKPELAAIAKLIGEAADRGAELTSHLLAFARKQALQPRETDVNALVLESARLLRPTLGENIEIATNLDAAACPALIDPGQLTTAILNLAVNARDAMPSGGRLMIETCNIELDEHYIRNNREATPGSYVMIAVSDTGTGIPRAIQDKVFEPFFSTKEVGKGTGLGLSMVYGFIKQSGGHVKIYSEPGKGNVVKLYLPRSVAQSMAQNDSAPPAELRGGSETILLVEDDVLVRKSVTTQLENLGYAVIAATDATEALKAVDSGAAFDLLFTDVIMPGPIGGVDLADEVTRRRPGTKILFTSGYTESAMIHHGRLDPGVLLLQKPHARGELARMLRMALDQRLPSPPRIAA